MPCAGLIIASDGSQGPRKARPLLMKFQLVHNFVDYFAVCHVMSGRKHLFCIDCGLYPSGERALKYSGSGDYQNRP